MNDIVGAFIHAETIDLVRHTPVPIKSPFPLKKHIAHFIRNVRVIPFRIHTAGNQYNICLLVMVYISKSNGCNVACELKHLSRRTFIGFQLVAFITDISFCIYNKKRQSFPSVIHSRHQRKFFISESFQGDGEHLFF